MNDRLSGKIAVVMGAGSSGPGWGNGKATAVTFARQGAKVMCVDVNPDAAAETADIIKGEGHSAEAFQADITNSGDIEELIARIKSEQQRIDILQNNVGIAIMGGPVELSEEEWQKVIDVNLTGMFRTCKHVLPIMLEQKSGAIVNISSIAAIRYVGYPYASYYATKAAINQFTAGLALQYARDGIRVNCIMPGLMDTPMIYNQISNQYASTEEMVAARNEASPTGKMGDAFDIANAALFLASDEAKYITGHSLPVDGGHSLKIG